jgi:hypothetical protein
MGVNRMISILEIFKKEKQIEDSTEGFFSRNEVSKILNSQGAYKVKSKGIPVMQIMLYLVNLVFTKKSMYMNNLTVISFCKENKTLQAKIWYPRFTEKRKTYLAWGVNLSYPKNSKKAITNYVDMVKQNCNAIQTLFQSHNFICLVRDNIGRHYDSKRSSGYNKYRA